MRFQVVTTVSMKMTVFWDVVLCSLVDSDQCFGGASCLHHQGALMMEAVSISETSVSEGISNSWFSLEIPNFTTTVNSQLSVCDFFLHKCTRVNYAFNVFPCPLGREGVGFERVYR
jgi:hypothetical protein